MPLSGHNDVALFNDVTNDAESTQKPIITSYSLDCRLNQLGKLINRIPGSRLLTSSLTDSALRTLVASLGKPRDVNKRSQNFVWKDTYLVFSIYNQGCRELFGLD